MIRKLVALSAAFAMLVYAAPAQAANEISHSRLKGLAAFAIFSSTDPSGCTVQAFVNASDDQIATRRGGPRDQSTVSLSVVRSEQCTGTPLVADGFASLAPDDFQIDKKLTAATLDITIRVSDPISGSSFPVEVNLTWTGVGAITTDQQRSKVRMPGFMVVSRVSGSSRDATATGTVSDGTTNFTPEPAVFAAMVSSKSGTLIITRT